MSITQGQIDKQAQEDAAQVAANLETLRGWLDKHPEISKGIGTEQMFQSYWDFTDPLTEADFDFAWGNMKGSDRFNITTHRVPTPEEVKAELIDKIMERLQATTNNHWQVPHNIKIERAKMQFWSLEQLIARLNEVVRFQEMSAKPIGELKQIVESGRKYTGFPQLGKTIVRPGTTRAVPLDAAYIKGLDTWELKKLCRLYGVEQVNHRLAGKE